MLSFVRKAVIITGACSEIGKAAAVAFAKDGAKLMITGTDRIQLEKVANECRTFEDCEVYQMTSDLSKFDTLKSIIDQTVEKYQRIDVLINCTEKMPMPLIPPDLWLPVDTKYVFNTKVKGPILLSKFALPHLKKTKGCVVNVSPPKSESYIVGRIPYCLTRMALSQFIERFAAENASFGVSAGTFGAIEPIHTNTSGLEIREFVKTISCQVCPVHEKKEAHSVFTNVVCACVESAQ